MGDKLINIVNKYNNKLCFIELERLVPIFNGKINGKYFILKTGKKNVNIFQVNRDKVENIDSIKEIEEKLDTIAS